MFTLTPSEWSTVSDLACGCELHRGRDAYHLKRGSKLVRVLESAEVGRLLFGRIIEPSGKSGFSLTPRGRGLGNARP